MIAKCIKGKSFRGAVEYDLQPHKSLLLESNMAGTAPRELAKEFGVIRALRPKLSKAVCHVSLSVHPDERLTDAQWREAGQAWLSGMGFENNQYIISRHTDAAHPHIHILVNRITMAGKVVTDAHDYKRQEPIMRMLEKRFNLRELTPSYETERKAPTKGEVEHAVRTGQPSARMRLQCLVDEALGQLGDLGQRPNYTAFKQYLNDNEVSVKLNEAQTGQISGISFALGEVRFKGSKLGKAYTWSSLQKRGLQHENGYSTGLVPQHNSGRESEATNGGDFGRTTNTGNEARFIKPAGNEEAERQRRIAENFAQLAKGYQRSEPGSSPERPRSKGLSR